MKKCRFCGYENPDGRHFCLYCHKTLDTFTSDFTSPEESITPAPNPGLGELSCPHCGKRNPADKMFCQNCRKSLKRISPVVEAEINCPHCNAKNPSSKAFCLHCGKSLHPIVEEPKRYCIQCGKPVIAENTICDSCREKKREQASLWIRAVASVLVLALLSGIAVHFVGNRAPKVKNANQAIAVMKELGEQYGYENAFSELTEKNTASIDGDHYYRLQQNYQGIPVYGKNVVCAVDQRARMEAVSGNPLDVDPGITLNPALSLDQAKVEIRNYCAEKYQGSNSELVYLSITDAPELNIFIDKENRSHLAYVAQITVYAPVFDVFEVVLDANSREILADYPQIYFDSNVRANLKGQKVLHKDVEFTSQNGINSLYDAKRDISGTKRSPLTQEQKDYIQEQTGKNYNNIIFSTEENLADNYTLIWSSPQTPDKDVVDAYVYTQIVYDYFSIKLNHRPNSGGKSIPVQVLTNIEYRYSETENEVSSHRNNAFGTIVNQQGKPTAFLGFGTASFRDCLSSNFFVVAHEYMHTVESCYSSMIYERESGAIMEALSDIFGELAGECYYSSLDSSYKIDWTGYGNRNMKNPHEGKKPSQYKGKYWGDTNDSTNHGYVHKNSTVISHAAYLMWNGINGDAPKKISSDQLAKLWYRAMLMMPTDCTFSECRTLVEWAAQSVNGLTNEQIQCVSEAFDKVGVYSKSGETQVDYRVAPGSTLTVLSRDGTPYTGYALDIEGFEITNIFPDIKISIGSTKKEYHQTTVADETPMTLNLPNGKYRFTISNGSNFYSFTVLVSNKYDDKTIIIQSDFENGKPSLRQLSQVDVYLDGQMWEQHVFHYDASGKMVSTDIRYFGFTPNEQITCRYTYDAEGRLIKADRDDWWLDFSNEEYEYDKNGRLVCYKKYWGSSEPTTVVTYSYDLMGRLMQAMESDQDGIAFTSTFEHNSKGQVVEENKLYKPDNRSWTYTYTYDDQGRVTSDDVFSSYSYVSYPGFVISRWSDGQQKLRIMDVEGHDIWSIYVGDSTLTTDADGYLIHSQPTENVPYEYRFFYTDN